MSQEQLSSQSKLEQDLAEMKVGFNTLNKQMGEFLTIFRGAHLNPHDKGLLGDFEDIKEDLRKHEKLIYLQNRRWERIKWTFIGMTLPTGVALWELFKKAFLHQ